MNYGYARVSSADQNEHRQIVSLAAKGVDMKNIFIDRQSGKDFDRPQYKRMVKKLKKGDLLIVHAIDRFGRNYKGIIEQWNYLTKKKGVDIAVLDMPLLDTRAHKDLLGTFVSDMFLQVLSYVAQTERENIRKRQAEGIAAAKLRGVKFGRPQKPLPDNWQEVYALYSDGVISGREAARRCEMEHSLFRRKAARYAAA